MQTTPSLYWKLSGFYFFFYVSMGVFGPYWTLYLKSLGYQATDISLLMAIFVGGSFIAPYLWSWLADHTGKSIALMRITSALGTISFGGMVLDQSFWWIAMALLGFSFFWNGVLPQLEANTMNHVSGEENNYGTVRLWGSFGFVVAAVVFGKALEKIDIELVPHITLGILAVVVVTTFMLPEGEKQEHKEEHLGIKHLLTKPEVLIFMGAAFLMFVSYSPYAAFYSIFMEESGYSRSTIGWLWAVGMIAEIGVFYIMSRLMAQFTIKNLLLISYLLTIIRWLLIGFCVDSLPLLIMAQFLQAACIGVYHTVSIYFIHLMFKGKYQYRGQAAYVCVAGLASFVGILCFGYFWEHYSPSINFTLAAVATSLAFLVTWRFLKFDEKEIIQQEGNLMDESSLKDDKYAQNQ